MKGGRDLAPGINRLLELPFKLKIATQDYHPSDHCSFASQHPGMKPFTSSHTIRNPAATDPSNAEEQTTTLWPDHCVQGTPGVELIPELHQSKLTHIVKKGEDKRVESYSAFGPPFRHPAVGMSNLETILKQASITRVYTCGLAFDFCVKHTAIDAAEAGFLTFVIEDLTNAVNARDWAGGQKVLEDANVRLVASEDVMKSCVSLE